MEELIHEFVTTITFSIPRTDLPNVWRALTTAHTGRETVPMTEVPPPELEKALWNVTAGQIIHVRVKVYKDGSTKLEFI